MSPSHENPKIVDVRLETGTSNTTSAASLRSAIVDGLEQPTGSKSLPTLLLYDERGLRLYNAITMGVEEYYLFQVEEEILRTRGSEIVKAMHGKGGAVDGEVVLELGAGALRKTSHLLRNLASLVEDKNADNHRPPPITYYALDLERQELSRTLNQINMRAGDSHSGIQGEDYGALGTELAGKVEVRGMWGTYEGGIHFINQGGLDKLRNEIAERDTNHNLAHMSNSSADSSSPSLSNSDLDSHHTETTPTCPPSSSLGHKVDDTPSKAPPLHILFLGSSLGSFSRNDMPSFLSSLPLRPGSGDTLLLGLDGDNGKALVENAYNDAGGTTREFIMNGLRGAGRALGDESLFANGKWEYVSVYNETKRRHEAYYKSVGSQSLDVPGAEGEKRKVLKFADGELVNIEYSHKFSANDIDVLFSQSNLCIIQKWSDERGLYGLYLLERKDEVPSGDTALGNKTQYDTALPSQSSSG